MNTEMTIKKLPVGMLKPAKYNPPENRLAHKKAVPGSTALDVKESF